MSGTKSPNPRPIFLVTGNTLPLKKYKMTTSEHANSSQKPLPHHRFALASSSLSLTGGSTMSPVPDPFPPLSFPSSSPPAKGIPLLYPSMVSKNKSEPHIRHQVKEACPSTSNSLPKKPGFKSSQEGCLSLKFKWIALGHKLSRGLGVRRGSGWIEGGAPSFTFIPNSHILLGNDLPRSKKKNNKVQLMGNTTDSRFSVLQPRTLYPTLPFPAQSPFIRQLTHFPSMPSSHWCNVNKI